MTYFHFFSPLDQIWPKVKVSEGKIRTYMPEYHKYLGQKKVFSLAWSSLKEWGLRWQSSLFWITRKKYLFIQQKVHSSAQMQIKAKEALDEHSAKVFIIVWEFSGLPVLSLLCSVSHISNGFVCIYSRLFLKEVQDNWLKLASRWKLILLDKT